MTGLQTPPLMPAMPFIHVYSGIAEERNHLAFEASECLSVDRLRQRVALWLDRPAEALVLLCGERTMEDGRALIEYRDSIGNQYAAIQTGPLVPVKLL